MTTLLEELNAELDSLEKSVEPTWSGLVDPIERITDRLSRAWGAVSHLKVRSLKATLSSARSVRKNCVLSRHHQTVNGSLLSPIAKIWFCSTI
jgi:Zn-dependent oligopeptidase